MAGFSFGQPVEKEYFFDRSSELAALLARAESIKKNARNDCALIGPRRVGKSSLTNRLMVECRKQNIRSILIDCEGLPLSVFLREYSNALIASELDEKNLAADFREKIKQGVSEAIYSLSEALGKIKAIEVKSPLIDFLALRIELEKNEESELRGGKLFDFLVKTLELPEKLGKKYLVVFDEFQDTSNYNVFEKNDFHALFRRAIQNQKNVCYIYTGSSVRMMEEIFGNSDNPLAANADLIYLGPFSQQDSVAFLKRGLKASGKKISEQECLAIYENTAGFPAYLNWIGLKLSEKKTSAITEIDVQETIKEMLYPTSPIFQSISKQLIKLGAATKNVLRIISFGNHEPQKIEKEAKVKNIYLYLARLQKYGLVKKQDSKYYLIDPVVEAYLKSI